MRPSALAFTLLALCSACPGGQTPATSSAAPALQAFYDAYLPLFERGATRAFLDDTTSILAPSLRQALIADYQASAADSTQIVGLDFDPFLNSQDPCSVYRVGADTSHQEPHLIEVRAICAADTSLAAIAVLERARTAWTLVDVRYPGDTISLRGILARLAADRSRPASTGPRS